MATWLFCLIIAILANFLTLSCWTNASELWIPQIGVETPRFNQTEITIEHLDTLDTVPYKSRFHHVLPKYAPFRINLTISSHLIACDKNRTFRNLNWKKACLEPDPYPGCHSGNVIGLYICWDSYYENGNYPHYSMKNLDQTKNNVTKSCNSGRKSGDKIQHGIGIAICAQRNKTHHIIMGQVQMSYSEKIYHLREIRLSNELIKGKREIKLPVQLATILTGPMDTILMDSNGTILNQDEPVMPIAGMFFGAKQQTTKIETLKASFADMISIRQSNGSLFRKLRFVYSDVSHYCHAFGPSEMNGKKFAFRGCNVIHKIPKIGAEIFGGNEEFYRHMLDLKKQICEFKWICWNRPDAFPTDIPRGRFTVPTYINNSSKNTEKLANPKEAFFEELGCNDNQRFFMGGHMPPEDISNESLKHWKECANKFNPREHHPRRSKRTVTTRKNFKWVLPIKSKVDESADESFDTIQQAIQNIEHHTCITFVNDDHVNDNEPHMYFTREPLCGDSPCISEGIGRDGLEPNHWYRLFCEARPPRHGVHFDTEHFGTIVHETGHALGLYHEMDRPDRDKYIWKDSAYKIDDDEIDLLGMPYDYSSVMHYQPMKWPKDSWGEYYNMISRPAIYQDSIGPNALEGLSFKDAKVLNFVYCDDKNCKGKLKENALGCMNGGYPDPKKGCRKCRCQDGFAGKKCTGLAKSNKKKCWSNMEFDIQPEEAGKFKLEGKLIGKGSCYWKIAPKDTIVWKFVIQWIKINKIIGLKCPMVKRDCGQNGWIFPCVNYLRIHFQDEKAESGARVCCQPELPFVLPVETLFNLSNNVLLALKIEEDIEEEVRFEMDITIGAIDKPTTTTIITTTSTTETKREGTKDAGETKSSTTTTTTTKKTTKLTTTTSSTTTTISTPTTMKLAMGCPDYTKLWRDERNPNTWGSRAFALDPKYNYETAYYNCHCVKHSTLTINGLITLPRDHSECPDGGCVRILTATCGPPLKALDELKPMFYVQCYEKNGEKGWYWKDGNGDFIHVVEYQCLDSH